MTKLTRMALLFLFAFVGGKSAFSQSEFPIKPFLPPLHLLQSEDDKKGNRLESLYFPATVVVNQAITVKNHPEAEVLSKILGKHIPNIFKSFQQDYFLKVVDLEPAELEYSFSVEYKKLDDCKQLVFIHQYWVSGLNQKDTLAESTVFSALCCENSNRHYEMLRGNFSNFTDDQWVSFLRGEVAMGMEKIAPFFQTPFKFASKSEVWEAESVPSKECNCSIGVQPTQALSGENQKTTTDLQQLIAMGIASAYQEKRLVREDPEAKSYLPYSFCKVFMGYTGSEKEVGAILKSSISEKDGKLLLNLSASGTNMKTSFKEEIPIDKTQLEKNYWRGIIRKISRACQKFEEQFVPSIQVD